MWNPIEVLPNHRPDFADATGLAAGRRRTLDIADITLGGSKSRQACGKPALPCNDMPFMTRIMLTPLFGRFL